MAFGIAMLPGWDFVEFLLWFIENLPRVVAVNVIAVFAAKPGKARWLCILFIPILIVTMISGVILGSWEDAARRGYDPALPSVREAIEVYVAEGTSKGGPDLETILESGNYAPTFGMEEIKYLIKDLLRHTFFHLDEHNTGNIKEGYDKGNDFFEATLDKEVMVYTSGIYKTGKETLKEAQKYKLDFVADAVELKKGDNVLDIGCGWGRLARHFTDLGAKVTGVTLSKEQRQWAMDNVGANEEGNPASPQIHLQDAMKLKERPDLLPATGTFDAITSLEMAEHVGIKRYQEFLREVHGLLKDDGVFYFQVAGLRRQWRYEDLVWGLFMGEHVFPGADASCAMGWVTSQLERGGFEVQRVHNLGYHYSITLYQWLECWRRHEDYINKNYTPEMYRRWEVFLAWSVRVARQGSSTVFMIAATKQGEKKTITPEIEAVREARRIQSQKHLLPTF
mmetsp:Transcript_21178/g.54683  ORF Transcript_21178/g.54683 Transcript_21178/m.54683 type:complete len:451 (-) Transcript_21178:567-1919(-)|eukprot:CAMPEP_0119541872 /NCGR_PEP_ID=MMETSP1344-20130328/53227_1 /TAXON_ID=236787 /ORGANISM="Florenciella parvula, Strain CCMP2471" /LENGTH=450 /DNA_ID=CAMNT_0007585961 /DNA_START=47 /DNA_END=1399 /DNA_ORIENTATION=-